MIYKNRIFKLLNLVAILVACIIAGIFINNTYKYDIFKQLKYIVFIIVYLVLPGLFCIKLLKIDLKKSSFSFLLAYFLGYSFLVIQYYIFNLLKIFFVIKYLSIGISLIYLILIVMKIKQVQIRQIIDDVNIITVNIGFIFLILAFATTIIANPHPEIAAHITYDQDFIWHIGNINALSQTFPVTDPRLLNSIFNYHYFNDLLYAVAKVVSGLDGFSLILYYSPLINIFIFIYSTYNFGLELLKGKKLAIGFTVLCTVVGNYDYIFRNRSLYPSLNTYFEHVITNENAVTVALPCILVLYMSIRYYLSSNENKWKMLVVICALTALATGLKGPFAIVLVAALIGTLITFAVNRELTKDRMLLGLCTGSSFLFVYILLLSNGASSAKVSLNTIFEIIKISVIGKIIISRVGDVPNYYYALGVPVHFLIAIGVAAVPLILMILSLIKYLFRLIRDAGKNKLDYDLVFSTLIAIIGCGGYYVIYQEGSSQMYFLFVAVPFIEYLCLTYINRNKSKTILMIYIVIGLTIGVLTTYNSCKNYESAAWKTYLSQKEYVSKGYSNQIDIHSNGITKEEYNALIWLKDNTNIQDICSSNRLYLWNSVSDKWARFFYYSAFSERNFLIEGYNYSYGTIPKEEIGLRKLDNKKLYEGESKEKMSVINKYKIKYILLSKYSDYKINYDFSGLNKVYENTDMVIYSAK